mmetsp:Transcript_29514/g.82458  ORF Transcript_29514/g.82458 Transcript_29514/m.82458 type:complete len:268 (+) Transcript_29514:454-1257(+)
MDERGPGGRGETRRTGSRTSSAGDRVRPKGAAGGHQRRITPTRDRKRVPDGAGKRAGLGLHGRGAPPSHRERSGAGGHEPSVRGYRDRRFGPSEVQAPPVLGAPNDLQRARVRSVGVGPGAVRPQRRGARPRVTTPHRRYGTPDGEGRSRPGRALRWGRDRAPAVYRGTPETGRPGRSRRRTRRSRRGTRTRGPRRATGTPRSEWSRTGERQPHMLQLSTVGTYRTQLPLVCDRAEHGDMGRHATSGAGRARPCWATEPSARRQWSG